MRFFIYTATHLQHLALRCTTRFFTTDTTSSLIRVTDVPAPHSGHIRILELNRPEARNAISVQLLADLRREIDAVATQYGPGGEELPIKAKMGGTIGENKKGATRAMIVASTSENCFCAGADLKERKVMNQEETDRFLSFLRATLNSLSTLPIPTITAISSLALGGGLELALSTNFRVLTTTAAVGLPETRLAILPGAGGTYRLPTLIGLSRARDLILSGRRVSAAEAYFLGIADRLVEVAPDTKEEKKNVLDIARRVALSEAVRLAQEICEGGPVAIRAALQAVNWANPEMEEKMYERVVKTEDRNEALKAFAEKRKPEFKVVINNVRLPCCPDGPSSLSPHRSFDISSTRYSSVTAQISKSATEITKDGLKDLSNKLESALNTARSAQDKASDMYDQAQDRAEEGAMEAKYKVNRAAVETKYEVNKRV